MMNDKRISSVASTKKITEVIASEFNNPAIDKYEITVATIAIVLLAFSDGNVNLASQHKRVMSGDILRAIEEIGGVK